MDPLNTESSVPRRRDSDVYFTGVIIIYTIEGGEEITNPSQIQSYEGFFFRDSKDFGQRRTLLALDMAECFIEFAFFSEQLGQVEMTTT